MSRGGNEAARARAQNARQTQGGVGIDLATERAITSIVERVMRQRTAEQDKTWEKVQVLLGERGEKASGDSAIRRKELLLGLERIPRATAAPTAAEFNALVDAYNSLIVALADIGRK